MGPRFPALGRYRASVTRDQLNAATRFVCSARLYAACSRRFAARPEMINAPLTTAGRCEIEKSEAIHDGQFASIQERKEASWRMRYEVRDGHVAREDERNWT